MKNPTGTSAGILLAILATQIVSSGIDNPQWLECEIGLLGNQLAAAPPRRARQCKRRLKSSVCQKHGENWQSLFDGKTLHGWKVTQFGGQGEVRVVDGTILMDAGYPLTGVTWEGEFPKIDYEISLEAMNVQGIDFFCGLTVPVADSFCSFVVGGWAGSVVGISSIDGKDASENDTTKYMQFKNNQWYRIRMRVTEEKIETWIDDKKIVDQNIVGKKITTRTEVDLSQPLGISAFETKAALRNIQFRRLKRP